MSGPCPLNAYVARNGALTAVSSASPLPCSITSRLARSRSTACCWNPSISLLLQTHLFQRRRPGEGVDQHQCRLLHPGPDPARPEIKPDGPEHHPLVHELLDLVQQGFAFRPVGLHVLLLEQLIDVGIAPPGERPGADHCFPK